MPPKVQKSKAAKALAASSSGGKAKKKKWSKGKLREKRNNLVVLSKALHDKILKDVPKKNKVITVYTLIENYKVNGSIARHMIREMHEAGSIKPVAHCSALQIYTKSGKD